MQAMHDRLVNANQAAAVAPLAAIKEENGAKKTTGNLTNLPCAPFSFAIRWPGKRFWSSKLRRNDNQIAKKKQLLSI
jgi:hypothetical protein